MKLTHEVINSLCAQRAEYIEQSIRNRENYTQLRVEIEGDFNLLLSLYEKTIEREDAGFNTPTNIGTPRTTLSGKHTQPYPEFVVDADGTIFAAAMMSAWSARNIAWDALLLLIEDELDTVTVFAEENL